MISPRSVTIAPIGMPSRTLNAAIDFFARVTTGFCPVIWPRSATAGSSSLDVLRRFPHAHVQDDLMQPRHRHRILEAELFLKRRLDVLLNFSFSLAAISFLSSSRSRIG